MADETILPYRELCTTTVSTGGLDIKVVRTTLTFTIGNANWEISVAELEAMLESHQLLKDACKQIVSTCLIVKSDTTSLFNKIEVLDDVEFVNAVRSAYQASYIAD